MGARAHEYHSISLGMVKPDLGFYRAWNERTEASQDRISGPMGGIAKGSALDDGGTVQGETIVKALEGV